MIEQTQVEIKDKFCLTIDEASVYFNIGEKKLRKIVADNIDTGFIIQNGVKMCIRDSFYLELKSTFPSEDIKQIHHSRYYLRDCCCNSCSCNI